MLFIFKWMKCISLFWNMFHASLLTTDKGSSWWSNRSVEKLQLWKGKSSHSASFLSRVVGPGFKFMLPGSNNRVDLKYLFKWTLDRASWESHFCNIYFLICSKVQNVLCVKNSLFSLFNVLKKNAGCQYQLFCLLIVWQIDSSAIL